MPTNVKIILNSVPNLEDFSFYFLSGNLQIKENLELLNLLPWLLSWHCFLLRRNSCGMVGFRFVCACDFVPITVGTGHLLYAKSELGVSL